MMELGFDLIPLVLAASEMGDVDLGLPEFRDDVLPEQDDDEPDNDG